MTSRRTFLAAALTAPAVTPVEAEAEQTPPSDADLRRVISRADLHYDKPAPRSEEGIPIGNGRMGSLVWTTPTQIRMQINRVDVYANDSSTNCFFERHNDYCGGCGYIDLDFAGEGAVPFPEAGFPQHLSVYDGTLAIEGNGVSSRVFAWPTQDVMAITVEDRRTARQPVSIALRMLRSETKYFGNQLEPMTRDHIVTVQNRNHTAASQLFVREGRIALTQDFRESAYCCKSAIAISVVGRAVRARILNETDVSITVTPGGSAFTILIASAATFDAQVDVLAAAFANLQAAESKGPLSLRQETEAWWHAFWPRSFVELHSADGAADYVEQNYHYFLYVMASSSRGKFPPKFNGMIFNTGGDLRTWGAQHWFANLSCYYEALPAANRFELMDPMFEMYFGMLDASSEAARQQWGSQGMYIAETSYFNGLEKLPDDIAAEMQDLYLLRKPWEQRSQRFMEFAHKHPHSSRWNWILNGNWVDGRYVITDHGSGPYGAVSHIFGSTAKVAYLFWRRYEFTLDRDWLRNRAYPMLRGAVEFYRNHPNLKKSEDGKYHLYWANSNESVYGARDTDEDISSMRATSASLVRAAEILRAEPDMLPVWREFRDNLPALPLSDNPEALKPADYAGPRVFVRGLKPAIKSGGLLPDSNSLPMWFFDLCNVESSDKQTLEVAGNSLTQAFRNGVNADTPVSVLSKLAIAAASLGRADAVRFLIPNQMRVLRPERAAAYKSGAVLANRMTLREGQQALDCQRLGRASEALHLALLQSNPPAPGQDPILHIFPAWPKEWDARFKLLARGAFVVSAAMKSGAIGEVEIASEAGAECVLRNPFNGDVALYRDGKKAETLSGSLLKFATRRGERIQVGPGPSPAG
jgi:Glycosyl hydrolase family 95 catalytic domain/Glycoside hydrolase family 95, C-terminal domain